MYNDKDCPFGDDKVFFQWKRLKEKRDTPEKSKRKTNKDQKNSRVARKKLRLSGKEYQTATGKVV